MDPSSNTKFEHETTAYENLKSHPPPNFEKIAIHPPKDKKLTPSSSSSSSSSSSPDSPLDLPFHSDDDDKSVSSTDSSPPRKSNHEPSDHGGPCVTTPHAIEPPSDQAMERDSVSSPYRIPSSVFARSKSNAPMEWSVASNESLFSIHGGNMSFRNDFRSGELGAPGGEASTSDKMFSYSAHQSRCGAVAEMRSRELGLAEATMKEVIKESECGNYDTSSLAAARNCRRSHGSGTSTKSFAFSIKAGDSEKSASSRLPSSVRSSAEQVQSQPLTPKKTEPQPSISCHDQTCTTTAATGNTSQQKWFSCLPCCSLW